MTALPGLAWLGGSIDRQRAVGVERRPDCVTGEMEALRWPACAATHWTGRLAGYPATLAPARRCRIRRASATTGMAGFGDSPRASPPTPPACRARSCRGG